MILRRAFLASTIVPALAAQHTAASMFSNAEAYERFMGRWSRLVAPLLIELTDVPDAGRVLDIGSGTGALAFEVAKRKPRIHVTGVDPSLEYVSYATSRSSFGNRVVFQQGDAQRLGFADRTFDASLSLLVFNFIPDAAMALRETRRVTKPQGRISAAVWDYGDNMRMLRVFWDAAVALDSGAQKLDEKHMPLCRSGDLSRLWREAGLENVHEQPLDTTLRFNSFAEYWEPFLLGQGPAGAYVRALDEKRVKKLRSAVKQRLSIPSEDKPFTLPARVWAVRGTVPSH